MLVTRLHNVSLAILASEQLGSLAVALAVLGFSGVVLRAVFLPRWRRFRATQQRTLAENALKHIHDSRNRGTPTTCESLAGSLIRSRRTIIRLINKMEAQGWLRKSDEGLLLTAEGLRLALQVIRAHRLWERYLVDEARMALTAVHAEAERREHDHGREKLDALDAAMGFPAVDPHGDPIPDAAGELAEVAGRPVTEMDLGQAARIVHLEDEPPAVFAQIVAEGFRLGQILWIVSGDAKRIVLADAEQEFVVAPVVAANIFVVPSGELKRGTPIRRLSSLKPGDHATVLGLDDALQGLTRRRLLDLGITPGTAIVAEVSSVFRDPVAYQVRNSLVALRRDQADCIFVDSNENGSTRYD